MKNKVLIKLLVPALDRDYDIFIPVNEFIWKVTKLIVKSVSDLSRINLDINKNYILINQSTGKIYKNNEIIIDTDIRNATELVLLEGNSQGGIV